MNTRKFNNRSKSTKKRRSGGQASSNFKAPHTAEQFFAKPSRSQELWTRITRIIGRMQDGNTTLSRASKEYGVDPRTVVKRGGIALRKSANGRYEPKKSDRLLRILKVPSQDGGREIAVIGSKQASVLGKYWSAVHKHLATGDASALLKFRGKHIVDASGARIPLITDLNELDRLGSAGVFRFESIYTGGN